MNHYSVTGFKKNKRNKKTHTLFLTTTLSTSDICKAMHKYKYVWNSIVDIDSFTDKPYTWKNRDDIEVNLTLFDEIYLVKLINL